MSAPIFRELSPDECHALLERNYVGRLAYTFKDKVGIEPIAYVSEPGSVYVRTAEGSKLTTIKHHPWVAFEVDEVEGPFDWQSVVVHGTAMILDRDGSEHDKEAYGRAVALLRKAAPGTFQDDDPVPFRNVVVVIYTDSITGRAAATR